MMNFERLAVKITARFLDGITVHKLFNLLR